MQRRYNLACFSLASVVVMVLTPLIVVVDAQARIAFMSDRDWNWEIYVMDNDGGNRETSLTTLVMISIPHGLRTATGLPLALIGMIWVGTDKSA